VIRIALFLFVVSASCGARGGVINDPGFLDVPGNWNPIGIHSGLPTYPFAIPAGTVELLSDVTTKTSTISQSINVVAGDILTFNWLAGLYPDVPDPLNKYASTAFWMLGTQRFTLADLDVSQADPIFGAASASGVVSHTVTTSMNGLVLKFGIEEVVPSINDTALTSLAIDALHITPTMQTPPGAVPEPGSAICICLLACTLLGTIRHRRPQLA
jgi:hypothetical protein